MRLPWKGLLALLGMIVLAGAAFTVHNKIGGVVEEISEKRAADKESKAAEEAAENAVSLEEATLPLMHISIGDQSVDTLRGYTTERDLSSSELPLIPVDDGSLSVDLVLYGNTLEEATYEIRQADTEEPIASGNFDSWDTSSETFVLTAALPATVPEDEDCLLTVKTVLGSGKTVWYYARVRKGTEFYASEMLDYVVSFHMGTYLSSKMFAYSSAIETDETEDSDTLTTVTIRGTANQVTWGNLSPTETEGTRTIQILEIDGKYGSFLVNFEVTAGENSDTYQASEYFTVRRTKNGVYLMNYCRRLTELFAGDSSRFSDGDVDLGIAETDDVSACRSEDGNFVSFSEGGELWCSGKLTGELMKIFTFRDEQDLLRSGYTGYSVKPLKTENDGSVTFLVYGYMNRGPHEGETGIACMKYDHTSNTTEEMFYMPIRESEELLVKDVDSFAAIGSSGDVYLTAGDTLYEVNPEKESVSVLADRITERNFVVNAGQTAAAWTPGDPEESDSDTISFKRDSVLIFYVDTEEQRTVEASDGEWITAEGFLEDDCILGMGRTGDQTEIRGETTDLRYAVVIQDRTGTEEAHYEYEGIYISDVEVLTDQIEMERVQADGSGGYKTIDSDNLIQNAADDSGNTVRFTTQSDTNRMRILILKDGAAGADAAAIQTESAGFVWAFSEDFSDDAVQTEDAELCYYAYAEGELLEKTETAGEAIALVYDGMGTVIDSEGHMIWYRTARDDAAAVTLESAETGTVAESRNNCLVLLSRCVNGSYNTASITDDMSAMEALDTLTQGRALNLTGAPLKALLYYISRGCCVMVTDSSGHSQVIVSYDAYNVKWYDPVSGENSVTGQEDAQTYLDNGCTVLGVLP